MENMHIAHSTHKTQTFSKRGGGMGDPPKKNSSPVASFHNSDPDRNDYDNAISQQVAEVAAVIRECQGAVIGCCMTACRCGNDTAFADMLQFLAQLYRPNLVGRGIGALQQRSALRKGIIGAGGVAILQAAETLVDEHEWIRGLVLAQLVHPLILFCAFDSDDIEHQRGIWQCDMVHNLEEQLALDVRPALAGGKDRAKRVTEARREQFRQPLQRNRLHNSGANTRESFEIRASGVATQRRAT